MNIISSTRTFKFKTVAVIKATTDFTMSCLLLSHKGQLYIMPIDYDNYGEAQPPVYGREVTVEANASYTTAHVKMLLLCRMCYDQNNKRYEYGINNMPINRMNERIKRASGCALLMSRGVIYSFNEFEITYPTLISAMKRHYCEED